jgi:ribonuclease BN (tRNA processing enzyme)
MLPGYAGHFGKCVVESFRVPHQEQEISLGLRITIGGKRILYTGDSGWTEDLVHWAEGTDLLICECSYFGTRLPSHLDYPRISENRRRFGTRRLILTHLGKEVLDRSGELDIEIAHDGLLVELP